jgi:hypothetical protein
LKTIQVIRNGALKNMKIVYKEPKEPQRKNSSRLFVFFVDGLSEKEMKNENRDSGWNGKHFSAGVD